MALARTMSSASFSGIWFSERPNSAASDLAERHEIIARIKPGRNLADIVAQRLAVAQHHGPCQHIDLRAGVVDVVFLGHVIACGAEQIGQRIAEHRAPAMADMHRPGRVGRDIFDIDLLPGPCRGLSIGRARLEKVSQMPLPEHRREPQIDEAGAGDLKALNVLVAAQSADQLFRHRARVQAERLGQHHRRIAGEIAMAGIARRLDRDARKIKRAAVLRLQIQRLQRFFYSL